MEEEGREKEEEKELRTKVHVSSLSSFSFLRFFSYFTSKQYTRNDDTFRISLL